MRIVLAPEARVELRDATTWYRKRSPAAARRFVEEYKRARGLISQDPHRWPEIEPGMRRVLFDKFPYALLYVVEQARVVVLVVKHDRQHPDYWRGDR